MASVSSDFNKLFDLDFYVNKHWLKPFGNVSSEIHAFLCNFSAADIRTSMLYQGIHPQHRSHPSRSDILGVHHFKHSLFSYLVEFMVYECIDANFLLSAENLSPYFCASRLFEHSVGNSLNTTAVNQSK
jgi:hypothetical protein